MIVKQIKIMYQLIVVYIKANYTILIVKLSH